MSLDALIGRVLMVAPPEGWLRGDTRWLEDLQPAGVILFRRNLPDDHEEARSAIARLHAWAAQRGETLLVGMDEEGGFVTQTSDYFPTPPSARALARGGNPGTTRQVFQHYGARLRALGANLDFAPVCDVNNNPLNPVIGVRSYAHSAAQVAAHALAAQQGLNAAGLLACAKHFPGHGDTDVDSHLALPIVHHDRDRFEAIELQPFRHLLPHVQSVMLAHLACPEIGDGNLPASLSVSIATRLLRKELQFDGVAITDSMDMQGITNEFGFEAAAPRALNAGCDLLLYCFDLQAPQRARKGIYQALADGVLSEERLREAAERVDHLRALALAVGDAPEAARPLPSFEEDLLLYSSLCRRSLQASQPEPWRALAHDLRRGSSITIGGWNKEVLSGVQRRLRERGYEVPLVAPEAGPHLLILAERRPLDPQVVAQVKAATAGVVRPLLANLLTPELDVSLRDSFAATVQTADASACMLDVFVEWLLEEGAA